MNTKKFLLGDFVTVAEVKNAEHKRCCIISSGSEKKYMERNYLELLVEMDGRRLFFRLNRKTLLNCIKEWGEESEKWVGRWLNLTIENGKNNMEMVIGIPTTLPLSITPLNEGGD